MKNLEKEYKEQLSHETPDLWSRIEAGVDAYEASKVASAPKETKTPASPTEVKKDNIVKFDSKKIINIIGKISVAAVLFLVVAVTYNVTRQGRMDSASTGPAEATMTDAQSASEATQSDDVAHEAESSEMAESPIINESPSVITEPETDRSDSKGASPTFNPSKPVNHEDYEASDAEVSLGKDTDIRAIDKTSRQLSISWEETFRIYRELTELGLTDISELTLVDGGANASLVYGSDYSDTTFDLASFTAGDDEVSYLLFYKTETGAEIMAVKNAETDEFIYINPVK